VGCSSIYPKKLEALLLCILQHGLQHFLGLHKGTRGEWDVMYASQRAVLAAGDELEV